MELTPQPFRAPRPDERRIRPGAQTFSTPIATPKALPPEALYHYWYPGREGIEPCPTDFAVRLAEVHADLAIVKPPPQAPTPTRPWLVWYRKPAVTYWLSPGWLLLFAWQTRDGEPLPLDNRVFANLYRISAREFGSGVRYFDHIVAQMAAEKAAREKADTAYRHDRSDDYFEYTKIKSSGRGNKFALHHDGTILPGRGEANWLADRGLASMPGEVAAEARAKQETTRARASARRGRTRRRKDP